MREESRKKVVLLLRWMVIIVTSYLILFGRGRVADLGLGQAFILAYVLSNIILSFLPGAWFSNPKLFYSLVVFDTAIVSLGMYLSENVTTDFYLVFFLIIIFASMSRNYRLLIAISGITACLYGALLFSWGLLHSEHLIMRIPFIFIMAGFYGYIVQTFMKEKQQQLAISEDKYRGLFENAHDGIIILRDPQFLIADINQEVKRLTGYEKEELLQKDFIDLFGPGAKEKAQVFFEEALQTGEARIDSISLLTKDDAPLDVDLSLKRIDLGHESFCQVILRDLTNLRIAQENAIMAEIGQIVSSTLNIEEVYERFAETVRKLIPCDRIAINVINHQDQTFTIPYVHRVDVAGRKMGDVIPLAGTAAQWVMQHRSSMLILEENWEEVIGRFPGLLPLFKAGFRSMMLIPLISKDQVIAVLNLQTFKKNAYTEADLKLAERVGTQIAGAITNVLLFLERKQVEEALRRSEEEARRLVQENAVMAEIGRIISSTLNIEEVYEGFAAEARKLIPFDRIMVALNNPEEGTATVTYASGLEFEGRRIGDVFPIPQSGNEEVMRTRRGLLIQPEAVEELEGRFSRLISTFKAGLRSMMTVPLISRDQVIGVLHLRYKKSKGYNDQNLRLAERIAAQIAGGIANAQLFNERKRAEEQIRKLNVELERQSTN